MLKKGLRVLQIVGLIILSQLPLVLAMGLSAEGIDKTVIMVISLCLFVIAIVSFICLGRRWHLLTKELSDWLSVKNILISLLGLVAIILISFIGHFLLSLEGVDDTANQELIEAIFKKLPVVIMFLAIVIMAPLSEEIICRGLIPDLFGERYRLLGHAFGTLIFAYLHNPTDFSSWVIYGGMGAVLAVIRYKTKHIEYSILTHGLNNLLGFLSMLFV